MARIPINNGGLPPDQLQLVEEFLVLYNQIDEHLQRLLRKNDDEHKSFGELVGEYEGLRDGFDAEAAFLRRYGRLRNALVHKRVREFEYVAVPTPRTLRRLREIHRLIFNPPTVGEEFARPVQEVTPQTNLADLLRLVNEGDYSQFPVYEGGQFRGVITENGIARWLAHHVTNLLSLVEFQEIRIQDILREEEDRPNVLFVRSDLEVSQLLRIFTKNRELEAVVITVQGTQNEPRLGIATRWDIARVRLVREIEEP